MTQPTDLMTSVFAYLDFYTRPKERAKKGYLQTWFSKEDHPADLWDQRDNAGGGWWRYSKLHPFNSVAGPEEIKFPNGHIEMPQIEWAEQNPYIPAKRKEIEQ